MKIGNLEVYGIIYKITNIINGKIYIGQTTDKRGFNGRYSFMGKGIERVYNYHKYYKDHNKNYNHYLLNSIEKYGFDAFKIIEVFDIAFSKNELDIKEDIWIKYFDCIHNGYNWREGGNNGRLSDELKKRLSIIHMGENNHFYGKHHTEETKQKLRDYMKGKYCGKNNPNYNNKWNEKQKEKARLRNLGKIVSDETKFKISIATKGTNNPMYGVHRFGNSNPFYGKEHSEKTKEKISKKAKERYKDKTNHPWYGRIGLKNPNCKKLICLDDLKVYASCKDAGNFYNCFSTNVSQVCRGKYKQTGGNHFKYIKDLNPKEYIEYDIEKN